MKSRYPRVSVRELEERGAITAIQDGNHGERHPKVADYVEDGIPFVMANNIGDGYVDIGSCQRITEDQARTLRIGFSTVGDVLLSHKGTLGNVALVTEADPFIMLTPQVTYYRTDNRKLLNRFLIYAFREPDFQSRMRSGGDQGTRPYIGITAQRRLEIQHPPLDAQQRIADILSTYDDLIENNRRRIALQEEVARQLFREWFVRLRFPGHEHTRITAGVPQGWERKSLGASFTTVLGGTPSRAKAEYWDGGTVPWINSGKVNELRIFEPSEFITEVGLKNSAAKLMPQGTTVIAITGATLGQVSMLEIECAANQSVVGIIDNSRVLSEWLYLTIKERISELVVRATGGAQVHINKDIVDTFEVVIPGAGISRNFMETVTPMFRQTANLLFQTSKLRAARELLLPKLMSGEIPV